MKTELRTTFLSFCLFTFFILFTGPLHPADDTNVPASRERDTCEKVSLDMFGEPPTPAADLVRPPKKVHDVSPQYPDLPPGTVPSLTGSTWAGEALIGRDGHVHEVFSLRDVVFDPPFPRFSKAIAEAVHGWRYAPIKIDGRAVPVCMPVTVTVDWR